MTDKEYPYEEMNSLALENLNDEYSPVYSISNNNVCIICHNIPSLPVTWNVLKGYMTIDSDKHLQVTKIDGFVYSIKCPSSIRNMICLHCANDYIYSLDSNSDKIMCPFRCCTGKNFGKDYFNNMFGNPKRNQDSGEEQEIWCLLFQYGVLNMKCNKCFHVSKDLDELIMHPRIRCLKRKSTCFKCNNVVQFDEVDAHRAKCGKGCVVSFLH
tara:strand:+ start:40 stop:675 length:636 start_codon:yes stop_codon:yes gene_type:complete